MLYMCTIYTAQHTLPTDRNTYNTDIHVHSHILRQKYITDIMSTDGHTFISVYIFNGIASVVYHCFVVHYICICW